MHTEQIPAHAEGFGHDIRHHSRSCYIDYLRLGMHAWVEDIGQSKVPLDSKCVLMLVNEDLGFPQLLASPAPPYLLSQPGM